MAERRRHETPAELFRPAIDGLSWGTVVNTAAIAKIALASVLSRPPSPVASLEGERPVATVDAAGSVQVAAEGAPAGTNCHRQVSAFSRLSGSVVHAHALP